MTDLLNYKETEALAVNNARSVLNIGARFLLINLHTIDLCMDLQESSKLFSS